MVELTLHWEDTDVNNSFFLTNGKTDTPANKINLLVRNKHYGNSCLKEATHLKTNQL